jgi:ribonucleoside-triphosphate reductase
VGFVGVYEYVKNKGLSIETVAGTKLAKRVLKRVEEAASDWQQAEAGQGISYNIEQIPAESMAVRLAEIDSLLGYNKNEFKLYSNQYIPLISEAPIYDRFKIQGEMDKFTSGGSILHINVDDAQPLTADQLLKLMDTARKTGTIYFAVNYAFSECEKKHMIIGKKEACPVCGGNIVAQFTRVVGFLTSTKSWNSVRRTYEYPNRKFYKNKTLEQ